VKKRKQSASIAFPIQLCHPTNEFPLNQKHSLLFQTLPSHLKLLLHLKKFFLTPKIIQTSGVARIFPNFSSTESETMFLDRELMVSISFLIFLNFSPEKLVLGCNTSIFDVVGKLILEGCRISWGVIDGLESFSGNVDSFRVDSSDLAEVKSGGFIFGFSRSFSYSKMASFSR
jgi:hypothetical protein